MIRASKSYKLLCGAMVLFFALLLVYAETLGFTGDEGFHLLTARLIQAGERPYIDFLFPQAPLNAYVNAGWMAMFGASWRSVHVLDAILTSLGIFLIADFIFVRFPVPRWRLPAALAAICAAGLNQIVVEYGPLAQAYGMCIFATAAAFRLCIYAIRKPQWWWAILPGLFAGIATASSLLTALVGPILLVWLLFYNAAGNRWAKGVALSAAAVVPFAPVFRLLAEGPRQTIFNLLQYHLLYRRLYWPETTQHDLEVMTSWIDSGQALLLILFAAFGVVFLMRLAKPGADRELEWTPNLKAELYLSALLAAGMGLEVSVAHPTLPRYFVLSVPFTAVIAVVGLYVLASRFTSSPVVPVIIFAALSILGLGKSLYERNQDVRTWSDYEAMAKEVDKVTPPKAPVYATELIYFLSGRRPPSGMEFYYSHKVPLSPADQVLYHIITEDDLKARLKNGFFATAVSCDDDEVKELTEYYTKTSVVDEDCTVLWDPKAKPAAPVTAPAVP